MGVHIESGNVHTLIFAENLVVLFKDEENAYYILRKLFTDCAIWEVGVKL